MFLRELVPCRSRVESIARNRKLPQNGRSTSEEVVRAMCDREMQI
ncbi:hypothetical protein QT972_34375 [Microcoleus sp. herbarium7]